LPIAGEVHLFSSLGNFLFPAFVEAGTIKKPLAGGRGDEMTKSYLPGSK